MPLCVLYMYVQYIVEQLPHYHQHKGVLLCQRMNTHEYRAGLSSPSPPRGKRSSCWVSYGYNPKPTTTKKVETGGLTKDGEAFAGSLLTVE